MAKPNGDRICWDWNPGLSGESVNSTVPPVDPDRTLLDQLATQAGLPPIRLRPDSAIAPLLFTIHNQRDPLTLDPDATIGVFQEAPRLCGHDEAGFNSGPVKERVVEFPRPGDGIAGFRLISELGRGAFGRVFLSEESLLGNRLVALKITKAEGDEPRILARLQHTHIVPIHSVHDDPLTGLRVMCMPYFGGANLAQVLEASTAVGRTQRDQRSLLKALDDVGMPPPSEVLGPDSPRRRSSIPSVDQAIDLRLDDLPAGLGTQIGTLVQPANRSMEPRYSTKLALPAARDKHAGLPPETSSQWRRSFTSQLSWFSRSTDPRRRRASDEFEGNNDRDPVQPARKFLREANFIRAAAWIIARLAEGLQHAHSHGLMHRDLKPSNILIAADGTPMLLDFNLAADLTVKVGEEDRVRMGGTLPYMAPEHLDAFHPNGTTAPEAVDERSDIYALGLILFEMIAGGRPFSEPEPHRPLLETIQIMIRERRAGAPSLKSIDSSVPEDLDAVVRKCLDPDPDRRHAHAGDLAEDIRRFLDDQPLKYTSEPSLRGRIAKWLRRNPRVTGASTVGLVGLTVVLSLCVTAYTVNRHLTFASARLKLKGFESRFPSCQFDLNIINGPVESLGRGITLAEDALAQAGVTLDPVKDQTSGGWLEVLAADEQTEVRHDLAEVILLVARARVFLADRTLSPEEQKRAVEKAIAWLDRAEAIDPTPTVTLYDDRAHYSTRVGNVQRAAQDRARSEKLPPSSGRDFYLLGTAMLGHGEPDRAEIALNQAISLNPQGFWPWFTLGLCHYDQKRFTESAGDFAVCTVLSPRFAWPWMNRGLALAHAGRLHEARSAYDQALKIDPLMSDALANRALIALELGDAESAVVDLNRAIDLGRREVNIQAARGEALGRSGKVAEALRLLDDLVAANPELALPRIARGTLRIHDDPQGAEADFRVILQSDACNVGALLGLARLKRVDAPQKSLDLVSQALTVDPNRLDAIELSAWLNGSLGRPEVRRDVDRLVRNPTAHRLYNAACSLALYCKQHPDPELSNQAVAYLYRAVQSGISVNLLPKDQDLVSLHAMPEFQRLILPQPPDGSLPAH